MTTKQQIRQIQQKREQLLQVMRETPRYDHVTLSRTLGELKRVALQEHKALCSYLGLPPTIEASIAELREVVDDIEATCMKVGSYVA